MIEKIVVPDIGENVVSGKVVAVHVKAGDAVDLDDTLIEMETDKAVVEIPATRKGRVAQVLVAEGDELKVGDVILTIETETPAGVRAEPEQSPQTGEETVVQASMAAGAAEPEAPGSATREPARRPVAASPAIRRLARELGVGIETVEGSGPRGRITEADIKKHVRLERPGAAGGPRPLPDFSRWGAVETVEMDTVRRLTAASTTASWLSIPHVTQFDKADITLLEEFLQKNSARVARAGGKLTLTPVLTRVCAQALKKFPRFNASLDLARQCLIFKHYVHIGIAVDTPRGLIMPVIRDADTKSITDLAVEIIDLAARARGKKIRAAELEGGTFSISNQGGIGGVGFTPIILWPQVAILGISRAALEPVAVEGQFQPRRMLPLSLSYDHRVIDGADAARFLRWICASLEQPMTMLL